MTNYRRASIAGGTYFFTVNLANRRSTLLVDHIDLLRDAIRHTRQCHPFVIDAMVVLPDHLHAVWTLPPDDADFPMRWRLIKTRFSHGLPSVEHRRVSRAGKGERGVWQRRYWEHLIRDEADFARHVDYIHGNPVKHRYVARAGDWPYSTFHRFVREGRLASDWGCEESEAVDIGEMV
jgi:putative transposase